ncbi:MAG: hypothetical protein J5522_09985 [Lachnospiraceae bacterium]|nr:hypothetical protein [Lachnospiraceae bacterium]
MRINDLINNIQNTNSTGLRVNDDLPSVDGAFFNDIKKSGNVGEGKGAAGFFKTIESKRITGSTYTLNEAKGLNEKEGFGEKMLSSLNGPKNNDKELVKNLTGDDYESLDEEGMSLEKFSKERLERAIERIKENREVREVRLAEGVEKQQEYRETVDRMAVMAKAATGTEKLIAKMLYDADLPVTEENIAEVSQAADTAQNAGKLTDSSESYLIRNNLMPTIENIYKAVHSGEMRQMPIDDTSWESLKEKVLEIVKEAGADSDKGLESAKWLVEHDLPVTAENILYKAELDAYKNAGSVSKEDIFGAAIRSMQEGGSAKEGIVISRLDEATAVIEKETENLINKIPFIRNEAIHLAFTQGATEENVTIPQLVKAEESIEGGTVPGNAGNTVHTGAVATLTKEEVTVRIQLEEVRVSLNIEAGRRLMANGIDILKDSLMQVSEGLRELKAEYFEGVYKEIEADYGKSSVTASEAAKLAVETEESLGKIYNAPLELYKATFSVRRNVTLAEISETGETLIKETVSASSASISINPASMTAALSSYESSSTEVRRDLGDSIKKAFAGSVDSLLTANGLDITEGNRRAVRILGYNSMEITAESIEEIKYFDAKVTGLIEKMTPPVVITMIRDGINPLDCTIDELDEKISSILKEQGNTAEQKYSEFLVRMEETNSITQNERNAYIGIYRLLYNVEKNDGAAIGSLLQSGRELTFGNLLTEERTMNLGVDLSADDDTAIRSSYYKNSVSAQINEAFIFQRRLAGEALDVTDPSRWDAALKGKDYQNVTIEGLHDGLYAGQGIETAGINNIPAVNESDAVLSVTKAENIVKTMTANSPVSAFLSSFGIKDSFSNRKAAEDIFFGSGKEDSAVSVTADELSTALESESRFDELLGIQTRRANVLTGQAFRTAVNAQAAAELNGRVERIEMLKALAGGGHYRMNVDDGDESKEVNLTFIRNTGDAGTVSIEVQKEGYHLQADLNMVVMEQSYSGQSVNGTASSVTTQAAVTKGNIYFAGFVPADATDKADSFKAALKEAGINADNINISAGARSEETYISYLANQKVQAEERREKTEEKTGKIDALYMAAKSFLSFF